MFSQSNYLSKFTSKLINYYILLLNLMKYTLIVFLIGLSFNSNCSALTQSQTHKTRLQQKDDTTGLDAELDSLMDKYEGSDKKQDFKPKTPVSVAQKKNNASNKDVEDMEYRLMTGTYTETSSNKAALDD